MNKMSGNFFLDYFPPPKYLAMPALGFDISDRSLKYVELRRKHGSYEVAKYGTRIIPKGIIESGEIKQKKDLVDFLSAVRKELGVKHIIVALPEEKAFLSMVKLPAINESEVRSALEVQLEEHVPLSPNDAIFDFELMENPKGSSLDSLKRLDVSLAVFPKQLIENYNDVFDKGGFEPLAFEMETGASARALIPNGEKRTYFIVDFGKTRTTFTIASEGKVQFTSTIRVAGDDLNAAIAKNFNVNVFEAVRIKKEKGLVKSKGNERFFDSLLPVVSVIRDEISRHISYWNSQMEERGAPFSSKEREKKRIAKILLCGGDSNLKGLPEYLSYELKAPVELANPWVNICSFDEHIPEIELKESLTYTTALGLALRSAEYK